MVSKTSSITQRTVAGGEQPKAEETQQQKETTRIETFSDGVFCIAITLLSIEISVEIAGPVSNQTLTQALLHKWPIYLAYFISFINVLLAWMGHHSLFKNLRNTDNNVMIANGFLLMLVALVPFPTKTLGIYLLTDALKTAVIFYTGYFVLISLGFRLLWHAASRKRQLLVHNLTKSDVRKISRSENTGLLCNTVVMLFAFINPWLALALSFLMWTYWIFYS
jgi:uncharacterized membrane protein